MLALLVKQRADDWLLTPLSLLMQCYSVCPQFTESQEQIKVIAEDWSSQDGSFSTNSPVSRAVHLNEVDLSQQIPGP